MGGTEEEAILAVEPRIRGAAATVTHAELHVTLVREKDAQVSFFQAIFQDLSPHHPSLPRLRGATRTNGTS